MRGLGRATAPVVESTGIRVSVIGSGHVGLTAGACLASLGHQVVCADRDVLRANRLRTGVLSLAEPGLTEIVRAEARAGRLSFSTRNVDAVVDADVVMLCLPTPRTLAGAADPRHLLGVVDEIAPHLAPGAVVAVKSSAPIGTAAQVATALGRSDVGVVVNPEFAVAGTAVQGFFEPDRIVVGGADPEAVRRVAALYDGIDAKLILTDAATAEAIEYAAHAYVATRMSLANAIAEVCELAGADLDVVVEGVGSDHRVGQALLRPGPGWGAPCLPGDADAMLRSPRGGEVDIALIRAANEDNRAHLDRMVHKVLAMLGSEDERKGLVVALWGLAARPGTDDLRDSPALEIGRRLSANGVRVRGYDPTVRRPYLGIQTTATPLEACRGASAIVVATAWAEFARIDLGAAGRTMRARNLVDLHNLWEPRAVVAHGFRYEGVGRAPAGPVASAAG